MINVPFFNFRILKKKHVTKEENIQRNVQDSSHYFIHDLAHFPRIKSPPGNIHLLNEIRVAVAIVPAKEQRAREHAKACGEFKKKIEFVCTG